MAHLRPKGRSNEHIGLDTPGALEAFMGVPERKRRKFRTQAGKGDQRRPAGPKSRYDANFDKLDWNNDDRYDVTDEECGNYL